MVKLETMSALAASNLLIELIVVVTGAEALD
jgi:hypothetical protein